MIIIYSINGSSVNFENTSYDYGVIYSSTAFVVLYFAIVSLSVIYIRLETYFDTTPWIARPETENCTCPFTGLQVNRKCPSCRCSVSKEAFRHSKNRWLLNFAGQQETLLWKRAKQSIHSPDKNQGRVDLDQILDFTGNICTLSVSSCCIGCHTWQRSFNIGRRITLIYALSSLFFAFFPSAFSVFLESIQTKGIAFKIMCGVLAHLLSASALVLELKSVARAVIFLIQNPGLPRPKIIQNIGTDGIFAKILKSYSI